MMFCSNCGKEIAEGIKFCSSCGKAVGAVPVGPAVSAVSQPPVSAPAVKKAAVQPLLSENRSPHKSLALLALAAAILFSIGPVLDFLWYRIFTLNYSEYLSILHSVTRIAGFIVGIIAFGKLRKVIGAATSYTAIILLAIDSVISMDIIFFNNFNR
jgi:hypothetical protein